MKPSLFVVSLLLLLITPIFSSAQALWGGLKKGAYEVGFKTLYVYDYARPAIVEQDLLGRPGASTGSAPGRQMQISLWYPASKAGKKMLYDEYINELAKEVDFSPVNTERKNKAIDKVIAMYRDYQQTDGFSATDLVKITSIATAASRDAASANGKFPLLIYPHWFSPMDGSIMSEYLASQGFVVAGISMKGSDSVLPEISPRGLKTMAQDIAFTINQLAQVPFVDISKVATMGVGFNATGCVMAMKDVSSIDAFISLEGGIISASEMQMFQQSGDINLVALAKPMLFVHAPHPNIDPTLSNYFKYANRHFLRFPAMTEYYFLNNGALETVVPGIIGKAPGDVKSGFETACIYVAQFLRYALLDDKEGKAFIERDPTINKVPTGIVEPSFQAGHPVPPGLHELKILCATERAAGLRRVYDELKATDPQPFTTATLVDVYNWLGYRRDDDFAIRLELVRIWMESHPTSSRGPFLMARLLNVQKKPDEAKVYYQKALDLLDADTDLVLDNAARVRIRTVSTQSLR